MALRAYPLMDTFARPADGLKIKSHIKSQSQSRSKDHSLRQFLHGSGCMQVEIGRLAGRLREQARSHIWTA
ncbi:hypothetical protein C3E98_006220 [Pseudomonas sp. MWU13-2625]|nr:hypothetical protein C3E98_006220 [Pseudomonas sp. MWU13-2625]